MLKAPPNVFVLALRWLLIARLTPVLAANASWSYGSGEPYERLQCQTSPSNPMSALLASLDAPQYHPLFHQYLGRSKGQYELGTPPLANKHDELSGTPCILALAPELTLFLHQVVTS